MSDARFLQSILNDRPIKQLDPTSTARGKFIKSLAPPQSSEARVAAFTLEALREFKSKADMVSQVEAAKQHPQSGHRQRPNYDNSRREMLKAKPDRASYLVFAFK